MWRANIPNSLFCPFHPTCSCRKLAQRKLPMSSLWRVGHERVLSLCDWIQAILFKTPNLSFDKVCESYWLKMWRLFFSWVFHNRDFPMWLAKCFWVEIYNICFFLICLVDRVRGFGILLDGPQSSRYIYIYMFIFYRYTHIYTHIHTHFDIPMTYV